MSPETAEHLKAELHDELHRLDKEQQAFRRHHKGTVRHRQAKIRIHRLHGLIRATEHDLKSLLRSEHSGRNHATGWAMSQVGVTEHPANSNWGHPVEDWIKRTGFGGPVFWCGCFVHEAVVVHGKAHISSGIRLAAGTYIIADAHAGHNGLTAVPFEHARKGDILVYWGGEHIGLCRGNPHGGIIPTVEGNTSPANSGSQYNGGCVAAKTRTRADVSVVARPAW